MEGAFFHLVFRFQLLLRLYHMFPLLHVVDLSLVEVKWISVTSCLGSVKFSKRDRLRKLFRHDALLVREGKLF